MALKFKLLNNLFVQYENGKVATILLQINSLFCMRIYAVYICMYVVFNIVLQSLLYCAQPTMYDENKEPLCLTAFDDY